MHRLDEALQLLGCDRAQQRHQQHVLLMAIQSFALETGDKEVEQACEVLMTKIRAAIAAPPDA